jgi:hypothetical protein
MQVIVNKKVRYTLIENDLYRRERPVMIGGVMYPDAEKCLSMLISWYWRCRDREDVILNGMPEWECTLLCQLGVLASPEPYGIRTARHEAIPTLVSVADQISLVLYHSEVREAVFKRPNGRIYFMDRKYP